MSREQLNASSILLRLNVRDSRSRPANTNQHIQSLWVMGCIRSSFALAINIGRNLCGGRLQFGSRCCHRHMRQLVFVKEGSHPRLRPIMGRRTQHDFGNIPLQQRLR
jgi:hypothetical protein